MRTSDGADAKEIVTSDPSGDWKWLTGRPCRTCFFILLTDLDCWQLSLPEAVIETRNVGEFWYLVCGSLAQLVATLVRLTKLLYAGPG